MSTQDNPGWTGKLVKVCIVCGAKYGTEPCQPERDGQISHGFCSDEHARAAKNRGVL